MATKRADTSVSEPRYNCPNGECEGFHERESVGALGSAPHFVCGGCGTASLWNGGDTGTWDLLAEEESDR